MEEEQKVVENVPEPVEAPAEDVQAKTEQKEEPTKITTPVKKDPKKVEAGRLSAISRAAKKRQREQLGVEEDTKGKNYPYWNPSSILYFGVPSIFLMGMFPASFLWACTIKEKKSELVVEYKPAQKNEEQRLPDTKKKKETVSLFD